MASRPSGLPAAAQAPAASSDRTSEPVSWFRQLLDRYESGDRGGAIHALIQASPPTVVNADEAAFEDIDRALDRLRKRADLNVPWIRLLRRARIRQARLAVLLHTDALMAAADLRQMRTFLQLARHSVDLLIDSRAEYAEDGPVGDAAFGPLRREAVRAGGGTSPREGTEWQHLEAFCRQWFLTVAPWLHGQGLLEDAQDATEGALDIWEDDPDFLLMRGSVEESSGTLMVVDPSLASQIYPTPHLNASRHRLDLAADDLRRVQRLAPDCREATLRLGRVRLLQGDLKGARRALEALREDPGADVFVKYHTFLFLGALEERAGNPAAAADAYRRATVIVPEAQASLLALSQLADATGDAQAARAWLTRSLAAVSRVREDPWWNYLKGQSRLTADRLERLRAQGLP